MYKWVIWRIDCLYNLCVLLVFYRMAINRWLAEWAMAPMTKMMWTMASMRTMGRRISQLMAMWTSIRSRSMRRRIRDQDCLMHRFPMTSNWMEMGRTMAIQMLLMMRKSRISGRYLICLTKSREASLRWKTWRLSWAVCRETRMRCEISLRIWTQTPMDRSPSKSCSAFYNKLRIEWPLQGYLKTRVLQEDQM